MTLTITTLGKLSIELNGEPVAGFVSRKAEALLVYLLCNPRSHPRDILATLLWGDYPEDRALGNLRVLLTSLRKQLDPFLTITRQTIGVNESGDYWLDVAEFEQRVMAIHQPQYTITNEIATQLAQTIDLYQGEFLAGFSIRQAIDFETWVLTERERLQKIAIQTLDELVTFYLEQGKYRDGLIHATRLVSLDPLREETHRQLMQLLTLNGQRSDALVQYETCRGVLAKELSVEPMQETTLLYDQIRAGALAIPMPARAGLLETSPQSSTFLAEAGDLAKPESQRGVFVARQRELAQLEQHLETVLADQGRVVFVTGEAGSGKTALMQAFAQQAQTTYPDLVAVAGNCNAHTGSGNPYLPFRDVLSLLTGNVAAKYTAGFLTPERARRLWTALPTTIQALADHGSYLVDSLILANDLLSRTATAMPTNRDLLDQLRELAERAKQRRSDLEQTHLFEQFTNVLQAIATDYPLLLILDDLHWADAASIDLLFHLGRRLGHGRILIVGTYRPEEVALGREDGRHPLEKVLTEFKRDFGEILVDLEKAMAVEGRGFVEAYLDSQPNRLTEAFRAALHQHTQGHPLFTIELLRTLQERGSLIQDEQGRWIEGPAVDWHMLPARVEGVIEERISRLEENFKDILTIASVEGEDFIAQVVARVQKSDTYSLVGQLSRELDQKHRLIGERGGQWVNEQRLYLYRFRHHLFQQHLYNRLGQVERELLHGEVGAVLESLFGAEAETIAPQLAWHFVEARQEKKALAYLIKAGDVAIRVHANTEAVTHYTHGLELARRTAANREQIIHLYSQRGRALELKSQFEQALANYEEMEKVTHQYGDRAMRLTTLMHQGQIRCTVNALFDPEQGEALSERALKLAHKLGDQAAEAKILWNLLNLYRWTNQLPQAIDCGERSLVLARQLNLREQMAFTLNDLAHIYGTIGRLDRAAETLCEVRDLWRELGNLPMLADSLATSAVYDGVYAGKFDQAMAFSEEAFQISQSIDNIWGQSYSRVIVGNAYWEQGRPDRAIAVMKESIQLSQLAGFIVPQILTRADLAFTYGELGAIERSLKKARLALEVAETQIPILRVYVLGVLAHLHLLQGNLTEAKAMIDRAKKDPNQETISLYFLHVLLADGELALRQGDYERVLVVTDTLLTDLSQTGARAYIPNVLYLQGQALLALGPKETARERWLKARAEAEAIGSRRLLWQILFALSQLETDPAEAERLREQAREIVEYISDNVDDPELRALFLGLSDVRAVFAG